MLIVGALLVVAAGLFLFSGRGPSAPGSPAATAPVEMAQMAPEAGQSPTNTASSAPPEASTAPEEAQSPATKTPEPSGAAQAPGAASPEGGDPAAYLLVTARGVQYEPIPLERETEFTLRQKDTGAENTIHVTQDSVRMAFSTCENQDCVEQGVVSLANRETEDFAQYDRLPAQRGHAGADYRGRGGAGGGRG